MPDFAHSPVLLQEVLAALRPRGGGVYVDGTLGGAGHAEAVLKASEPDGRLIGFDQDADAVAAARERLRAFDGRFEIYQENYAGMAQHLEPGSCDGVMLDLGVSSYQLDTAERGFSFQRDGSLDMRMDQRRPVTAADLVNDLTVEELARIFREYGEEPQARRMARRIGVEREKQRIATTGQLAQLLAQCAPRHGKKRHPATRVFQALRMAVNDETKSLESGLAAACLLLKPGGRLAVITFHSIEDRMVKRFGNEQARDYDFPGEVDVPELRIPRPARMRWIVKKPVTPAPEEQAANPRSRSAKLRVLEKSDQADSASPPVGS